MHSGVARVGYPVPGGRRAYPAQTQPHTHPDQNVSSHYLELIMNKIQIFSLNFS